MFAKPAPILFTAAALAGLVNIPAAWAQENATTYKAALQPLNSQTAGSETTGEAIFTVSGDELKMHVSVEGAPPDIEHWQHFHGFAEGDQQSKCPDMSADANSDGIIDLIETEPVAGTTMVPFNADPAAMAVPENTYPKADASGTYTYDATVSMKALEAAFQKTFPDQKLDLARRVVFIHGVPSSTELPASVASLGDIPAQVTLPIACGEIQEQQ